MKTNPRVSVIVPVFNTGDFLEQCLDSILRQNESNIEVICVDDGSTDGSLDILRTYQANDTRIIIIEQENGGGGAARNAGLKIAEGEYLAFIDSDDFIEPDLFSLACNKADATNADIVMFGARNYHNNTGKYSSKEAVFKGICPTSEYFSPIEIPRFLFQLCVPAPWCKIYRRSFVIANNLNFQELHNANDLLFFISSFSVARRISYVDKVLISYRIGLTSNTQSKKEEAPTCFFEALTASKAFLQQNGLYDLYEDSFMDAVKSNVSWNFNTIGRGFLPSSTRSKMLSTLGMQWDFASGTASIAVDAFGTSGITISVIIPVYNDEKYIGKCLDSVINQTLQNIEIICVDDGSTDNSALILDEYEQIDSRISVISEGKNNGSFIARKIGSLAAKGKYILYVDADDTLDANACETALSFVASRPVDIFQFKADVINCSGDSSAEEYYKAVLAPKELALSNSKHILNMFFVDRTNITSMWGKLYSASMVKTAYNQMPDLFSCVGEDTFTQFFFAYFSTSYASVNTKAYYFYHYGLGISNEEKTTLEKFKAFCDMGRFVSIAEQFLLERGVYDEYKPFCEAMGLRMAEDVSRAYHNLSDSCDAKECSRYLVHTWQSSSVMDEAFTKMLKSPYDRLKARMLSEHKVVLDNRDVSITPIVSIIIPVYNAEKYLRECLDSVVNQTLRDIEIICIDDGSTDNSIEIAKEYCDDKRIVFLSQQNKGLSSVRNLGMKYARGEYVHFLDSDDYMSVDAYKNLYTQANEQELDILCFSSRAFCEEDTLSGFVENYNPPYKYKTDIPPVSGERLFCIFQEAHVNFASACLSLYRRNYLDELDASFIEGIIHEDEAFTFEVMLSAHRVAYTKQEFYIRRIHAGSTMTEPKSVKNLRGYLTAYFNMCTFAMNNCFAIDTQKCVDGKLENLRKSICVLFVKLKGAENYLSKYEITLIRNLSSCKEDRGIIRILTGVQKKYRKFVAYAKNYGMKRAIIRSQCFVKDKLDYYLKRFWKAISVKD